MKKILALLLVALFAVPVSSWALKAGDPMIPFVLQTDDGKTVDSANLVGKGTIVLNFMNTACSTCVAEMNLVKKLVVENPNVQFYPVAVDMRGAEAIGKYKADLGFNFTFLLDPKFETARKYLASSTPHTVVIGNDGMIKSIMFGYDPSNEADLKAAFK